MTAHDRRATDRPRARWRRRAGFTGAAVVALAVLTLGVTLGVTGDRTTQNQALIARIDALQKDQGRSARAVLRQSCERLNRTRQALRTIIRRGDRNLAKFFADGAITTAQYRRALRASADARRRLYDADCVRLSRRIPVS